MKRLTRLDLNLFQIFDTIYTKGGVSAAARHLNLSQPAVSHALAKLRDMFGDPLFIRQGNALVPTAAARAIAEPIRDALRGFITALESTSGFDPAQSTREFRIGIRLAGEMLRFPELAARVLAEAPHARLVSAAFRRRDLVQALANGELDLAFDVALPHEARLCRQYMGVDTLVVAARPGHSGIGSTLDLDTYLALDHVVATVRPHGPGLEDIALQHSGLQRRVVVRCQHTITAWKIVASSNLICTLPRMHAQTMQAIWPMQLFDVPVAVASSGSYLYWHQSAEGDAGLAWLRAIALDVMQGHG